MVSVADGTQLLATQTATAAAIGFESVFGKAIPLLIGKCVVQGQVFWSSADAVTKTTTSTVLAAQPSVTTSSPVTFAVAFGKPDKSAAKSYISRIWLNGDIAYDATGNTPVTAEGLTFNVYGGSETQPVDPVMSGIIGKYCPAFRGLIYAVVIGVNFTNLSTFPNIVGEITQTDETTFPINHPVGTSADGSELYFAAVPDENANTLNMFFSGGIDVFDLSTETLIYTLPFTNADGSSLVINHTHATALTVLTNNRCVIQQYAGDNEQLAFLYTIDMTSGVVLSSLAPPFTDDPVLGQRFAADELVVSSDQSSYVLGADYSYYGALMAFNIIGSSLNLYKELDATRNGPIWTGIIAAPIGDFPPCMYKAAYVLRNSVVQYPIIAAGVGGPQFDYTKPYNRAFYATSFTLTPPGGKAGSVNIIVGQSGSVQLSIGAGVSTSIADVTAPDPTFFFTALDTTKFSVFYVIKNGNEIWRVILCGGQDVTIAQVAAPANNVATVRNTAATAATVNGTIYANTDNGGYADDSEYYGANGNAGVIEQPGNPGALYTDPEVMDGTIGGYSILIGNEPMITKTSGGDRFEQIYAAGPNETIQWIVAGPADNPYVGAIIYNTVTKVTVYRKFDTFWSRQSTVSDDGVFDCNYYLVNGTDRYSDNMVFVSPPMRDAVFNFFDAYADLVIPSMSADLDHLNNVKQFNYGEGIFSYGSVDAGGLLALIDTAAPSLTTQPASNFVDAATGAPFTAALPVTATYDAISGLIFCANSTLNFYLNAGAPLGDTTLSAVLSSLLQFCGYTADQIQTANLEAIPVQGMVINQTVSLTSLLDAVRQVFSLDIFDTNDAINFVRKTRGANLLYDYQCTDDDLFPAGEASGLSGQNLVEYVRAYAGDLPTRQNLEYIDGPNFGTVGTQYAKRTIFPAMTTAADQTADTSVPVIMDAATAIYWVNAMLFDKWASSLETKFRLGPEAFVIEPGDYIAINRTNGTTEAVRVIATTMNKDRSFSIDSTSLIQFNDFTGVGSQAPTISVATLAKNTPPVKGIIENILFFLADDTGGIPVRFTSDQVCALQTYDTATQTYQTAAGAKSQSACGTLVKGAPVASNYGLRCVWEADNSTQLLVRFKTKQSISSAQTQDAWYGGKCVLLIGQPGRWECIYYDSAAAADATGLLWTFSGLLRGRRGTDYLAGVSKAGDIAIVPLAGAGAASLALVTLPLSDQGVGVAARLQPSAGGTSTAYSIQPGASHAPWSPCQLACVRTASATQSGRFDLAFAWLRRTRDESDDLEDGTPNVTMDFATEAYAGSVLSGGTTLRTFTPSTPNFVYTAEMQIADGLANDPSTIGLAIAQVGNATTGQIAQQQFNF